VVADRATVGDVTPVPDSVSKWGLPEALSLTDTLPVLFPDDVGENFTVSVQVALGASMAGSVPQVLVCVNSLSPVIEIPEIVSEADPLDLMVAMSELLLETCTLPNAKLEGVKLMPGFEVVPNV
jgi:hypothetical protein